MADQDSASSSTSTAASGKQESDPKQMRRYAIRSYRYLRLAIIAILLTLIWSVLLERFNARCWEESISTYFYTPVHSIFVGSLVALGVCLIAIRGSTDLEEVLLNVAGVLAPIVAFVPTSRPTTTSACTTNPFEGGEALPYINNNLVAFGLALLFALAVAIATLFKVDGEGKRKLDKLTVGGVVLSGVLLAIGIGWYAIGRDSFLARAHGGGAIALFTLVGIVVFINALTSQRPYKVGYWIIAPTMLLTYVAIFVVQLINPDWRRGVLWLELIELSLLLVFWAMQTKELWDEGVPTGAEREARDQAARSSRTGQAIAKLTGQNLAPEPGADGAER
jgi:hypothetical protein